MAVCGECFNLPNFKFSIFVDNSSGVDTYTAYVGSEHNNSSVSGLSEVEITDFVTWQIAVRNHVADRTFNTTSKIDDK